MSELLPCPHHEEEVLPDRFCRRHSYPQIKPWSVEYVCPKCNWTALGIGDTEEEADKNAAHEWNTRYERTCHPVWKAIKNSGVEACECSECGSSLNDLGAGVGDGIFTYCPRCGAKVVDDE